MDEGKKNELDRTAKIRRYDEFESMLSTQGQTLDSVHDAINVVPARVVATGRSISGRELPFTCLPQQEDELLHNMGEDTEKG